MKIRTIKPEWLEDERLALASPPARVMSVALICMADDFGRGRAGLAQLAGRVFPGQPVSVAEDAMVELEAMRYVRRYEADGQRYYEIRNWRKHQRIDNHGRGPRALVPEPPGEEVCAPPAEHVRPPGAHIPPGPGPGPGPRPGTGPRPGSHTARACVPARDEGDPHAHAHALSEPDLVCQARTLALVDAAWQQATGVALGVEMAAGPKQLKAADAIARWARQHDPGAWEAAVTAIATNAARGMGDDVRSPLLVLADSPGMWLKPRRRAPSKGPAPPRRNDEFEHDDPEEFWARVRAEEQAEAEAKRAAGE